MCMSIVVLGPWSLYQFTVQYQHNILSRNIISESVPPATLLGSDTIRQSRIIIATNTIRLHNSVSLLLYNVKTKMYHNLIRNKDTSRHIYVSPNVPNSECTQYLLMQYFVTQFEI